MMMMTTVIAIAAIVGMVATVIAIGAVVGVAAAERVSGIVRLPGTCFSSEKMDLFSDEPMETHDAHIRYN